jgi:hypothetical protein
MIPFVTLLLALAHSMLQVLQYTQIVHRVDVMGDRQREGSTPFGARAIRTRHAAEERK